MASAILERLGRREAVCRGQEFAEHHVHGLGFRLLALLYTVFFFIEPYQQHSAVVWLKFAAFYTLFVALFLSIPYTRGLFRVFLFVVFFAIGYVYVPFNPSASGAYVYPMALLPFILRDTSRTFVFLILQLAGIMTEGLLLNMNPWSYSMGAFFTIVVTLSNLFFMYRGRAQRTLHLAQDEIERLAKTAERERIARDLHDVLGHTLTLVVLKSQVAEQMIATDPTKAAQEVSEIQATARQALAEVREAVLGFRSHGLKAEMERAQDSLASSKIECSFSLEPETLPALLSREQEMVLTLSVREAVTNIMRHSAAKRCWFTLKVEEDHVWAEMRDDGKGGLAEGGFGLRGMRERVEMLGGTLKIDGASGMTLLVNLPLRQQLEAL